MPANRNALIRYKTIDKCLQNHYRDWTLEDLIEACSEALYEYEGIDKGVSKRTTQADIQLMRSDKLGYNAPIIVVDKKYYKYEDPNYTITNIPLTEQDLDKLNETVDFLKQFQGFSHFRELDGMIQKLEDHVHSKKTNDLPVIDFEKNENLKGLEYLDVIYNSILNRKVIQFEYKSFKARTSHTFLFHPYLLKEFRNRWFVIGIRNQETNLVTLALDRIVDINVLDKTFILPSSFNSADYFKDVIGVTVSPSLKAEKVVLFVSKKHAPYVLTKPFHWSQKLIKEEYFGITIELEVQHNFELEKEILGIGDGIKVVSPESLKRNIQNRLSNAIESYNTDISDKGIKDAIQKVKHKGYCTFHFVYTSRVIKKINKLIHKYLENSDEKSVEIEMDSELSKLLYNENLFYMMKNLHKALSISKLELLTDYNEKWLQISSYSDSHSYTVILFLTELSNKNGYFELVPGSQNRLLTQTEIDSITTNSIPHTCKVPNGGVLIMNQKILHRYVKNSTFRNAKMIKMEFTINHE